MSGLPSPGGEPDTVGDPGAVAIPSPVADVVIGLVLAGLAGAFLWGTRELDGPDHTGIGPATFPTGIAVLFAVTSLVLVGRGALALATPGQTPPIVVGRPLCVAIGIGLVCLFPVMMERLGYYVATAIWLPVFLLAAGYRKPLGLLLYTAGFLAFAKLAFEVMLGVRLP